MANLTFDDVIKTFDDRGDEIVAVDDLNMEIEDGEFVVIVGPSGCGKTTTLRMVAGLEDITDGDIRLGENSIYGKRPQERDIAMVFQNYALYPHMTVRENMAFGLRQSTDLSADEIDRQVEETAGMMGIGDLLERKPGELSGGQQQRVALGRAIVRDPEVFLLDEPLANLDAKLRAEMRTELQRLQEDLETTTIYVTHDQTEAMTMSDRVAILNDGQLQQIGTPLECYFEPANQFVAGFIGEPSMNFIDCTRDGNLLQTDAFDYEISDETASTLGSSTELVLGIRPENVEVASEAERPNDVPVTVDVVEPFGKENNLYLVPDDGDFDLTIVATVASRLTIEEGDQLGMRFPEEHIHVFDREDEGRALKHPTPEEEELVSLTPE